MKYVTSIILTLTLFSYTYADEEFKWCLYFFNFNAPMKPEFEAQFDELAEFIKSYPDSAFEISGHVDERWNPNLSLKLHLKRADFVKKYLIENYSIPDSMLVSVGRGNSEPFIKRAQTEAEHEWNRRVEITFIRKQ